MEMLLKLKKPFTKQRIKIGVIFSIFGLIIWLLISLLTPMIGKTDLFVSNICIYLAKFWEYFHYPVNAYFLPIFDKLGTHSDEIRKYELLYVFICILQDFIIGYCLSFFLIKKNE